MIKSSRKLALVAILFGSLLYIGIYIYGVHSDSFVFIRSEISSSHEIIAKIGVVKDVSLDPVGRYREKFFNGKKRASMTVNVRGTSGKLQADVSATRVDGGWTLDDIRVDGKSIYHQASGTR